MRQELCSYIHSSALVKWMVLEKRSLPDVAVWLYKEVDRIDMKEWLEDVGCSPVSSQSIDHNLDAVHGASAEQDARVS